MDFDFGNLLSYRTAGSPDFYDIDPGRTFPAGFVATIPLNRVNACFGVRESICVDELPPDVEAFYLHGGGLI